MVEILLVRSWVVGCASVMGNLPMSIQPRDFYWAGGLNSEAAISSKEFCHFHSFQEVFQSLQYTVSPHLASLIGFWKPPLSEPMYDKQNFTIG